ncbi:MAG: HTTM domain-containing protein [Flavobacteriales bacterium]|nr:MAG: HTTM domain-containing protein [Flavobacteriales bacterium]
MSNTIALFRWSAMAWLAAYAFSILLLGDGAWISAPVQLSPRGGVLQAIGELVFALPVPVCTGLVVCMLLLVACLAWKPRWHLGLVVWLLFRVVSHRMWLASNGGVQLMENMLLWLPLMHVRPGGAISTTAFRLARFQLLLAYAAAAAHKFTGSAWLDGTAVVLVATDAQFHLGWLLRMPWLCTVLTYAALAWMTTFPFALWWRGTRRPWLLIGVLFHIGTAVFMGIPQMGLAFIACYALWMQDDEAERIISWLRQRVRRSPMAA